MTFSADLSLGNVLIVVTLIGIAIKIGRQVGTVETVANAHAELIKAHSQRLDSYELRLVVVVGDVQRLIGRVEATQERIERATGQRHGESG